MTQQALRTPSVIIIGAGMTGIMYAIKLQKAGITDITILEKRDEVGGTWRENTYPGVACDVPANLYSYKFALNPNWSERFAGGEELHQYFKGVADQFGLARLIRYNEVVTSSVWQNGQWQLETESGNKYAADMVVCATGILHAPAFPDIPGLESFAGDMMHTAQWNHDVDMADKRFGIIGTGSTSVQIVASLVDKVKHMTIFQRTAQWYFPLPSGSYSESRKRRHNRDVWRPALAMTFYNFIFEQVIAKAVVGYKFQHALMKLGCKLNFLLGVRDKELRKKLSPTYEPGCKRLVFSSRFYPALRRKHVDLVTEGIEKIEPNGVVTNDGKLHELDVLVLSTGFNSMAYMRPMKLIGRNGVDIEDQWKDSLQAYRSLFIPNFPNFFLALGPNSPVGNVSAIDMSDVQSDYLLKLVQKWREREMDEIEATPEAMQKYNDFLKAGFGKTVWTTGCRSWYQDPAGNLLVWPYNWKIYRAQMTNPEMGDFCQTNEPVAANDPMLEAI